MLPPSKRLRSESPHTKLPQSPRKTVRQHKQHLSAMSPPHLAAPHDASAAPDTASPHSCTSKSPESSASAPTMTFSTSSSLDSSADTPDPPDVDGAGGALADAELLYASPQHSIFADIKNWSTTPPGPPAPLSDAWQSTDHLFLPTAVSSPQPAFMLPPAGPSHSSGSSYRGSTDELMGAAIASTSPGLVTHSFSSLGLNHFEPPSPSSPYPTSAPPAPLVETPPFAAIYRETRKGADLGLGLEDFEVLQTLGTGTFGRVMLVRLLRAPLQNLPQYFAMKVLSKNDVVRLKQVQHINSERAILASVRHSGLVNLFCTFQDERNLYLLMEFIQGGELFSHLRRAGRFSADVSRFYAANIIVALEYLHNRDIIYRDLKPENLLLDHQGYIKMTDFGFAKFVPERTFTLCGTPEYLAPEIIQSTGHGKAADYWALGVLLFEMMCGYPAFWADNPLGIYEKILAGQLQFPDHVHPIGRDLIKRLLSADLTRRLGNLKGGICDIMKHPWFDGVDWDLVRRRLIMAPIIPRARSEGDCSHFERYAQVDLESLPALARAQRKRYSQARGMYLEPSDAEKERLRRQIELEDVYAGYFFDF